jgi:hypothetical protein
MRNGRGFGTQTLGGFLECFGEKNEQRLLFVDDCNYVRHSLGHKPEREPLRGVCGSYLRQSWNVEISSLQRVEKNFR